MNGKEFIKATKKQKKSCFYCFFHLLCGNNADFAGFFSNFVAELENIHIINKNKIKVICATFP